MNKKISPLVPLFIAVGLIASSVYLYSQNKTSLNYLDALQKINSGRIVCSQRVTQSFTGYMINNPGSYLSESFLKQTHDCFKRMQNLSSQLDDQPIIAKTNTLSSEAYWLLETIKQEDSSQADIIDRYKDFEAQMKTWDEFYTSKLKNYSQAPVRGGRWLLGLLIGAVLCALYFALKWASQEEVSSKKNTKSQFGQWAQKQQEKRQARALQKAVEKEEKIKAEKRKAIVIPPLPVNEIQKSVIEEEGILLVDAPLATTLESPETPETSYPEGKNLNLIMQGILGVFSNKVMLKEVFLDYSLEEDLWVDVEGDKIYQVIYSLINYGLDHLMEGQDKKMLLHAQYIDDQVLLNLNFKGVSINRVEAQEFNKGIGAGKAMLSSDLQLCLELLEGTKYKTSISSKEDKAYIEVVLPRGQEPLKEENYFYQELV